MGRALVERYEAHDEDLMDRFMAEAEERTDDPLEQVLWFVRRFEEEMDELTEPYPGCLFASYCYQNELFDRESAAVVERGLLRWRERMGEKLQAAMESGDALHDVDHRDLADLLTVVFEGSFVLSKALEEPGAVARQLRLYRGYLELLFGIPSQA